MRIKHSLVFLLLMIALVSCGQQQGSQSTSAWQSDATPSWTPQSTMQMTPSPLPQVADLITPAPLYTPLTKQVLTSPDAQWLAEASFEHLNGGESFRVKLVVYKIDGSLEWTPVDYTQEGIGYIYPALRYWSHDSRFFYYFNMSAGDGCGDFYPIEKEWVVLDVQSGALSSLPLPEGRGHTFSHDGDILIYTSTNPPYGLYFRNTSDSSEYLLPLPIGTIEGQEIQAGGAVWSPDNSSFAMSVAYGNPCRGEPSSFSVVRIDNPLDPTLTILISANSKLIRVLEWGSSDRILVKDWDNRSWWIHALTGQTVAAPPTGDP